MDSDLVPEPELFAVLVILCDGVYCAMVGQWCQSAQHRDLEELREAITIALVTQSALTSGWCTSGFPEVMRAFRDRTQTIFAFEDDPEDGYAIVDRWWVHPRSSGWRIKPEDTG